MVQLASKGYSLSECTNMFFFLFDDVQISSKGYSECTFGSTVPLTRCWTPELVLVEYGTKDYLEQFCLRLSSSVELIFGEIFA